MRLMARLHKGTEGSNLGSRWAWESVITTLAGICHQTHVKSAEEARSCSSTSDHRFPVSTYRELELAAFLSLDHGANFGAEGVEGEGFRQHVHARLEKPASKRCVLGVSGYEKYF